MKTAIPKRVSSILLVLFFLLSATNASAYSWWIDLNTGDPITLTNSHIQMHPLECNFPAGSQARQDLQESVNEWNDVYGMKDTLSLENKPCPSSVGDRLNSRDGNSEIGYAIILQQDVTALATVFRERLVTDSDGQLRIAESDIYFENKQNQNYRYGNLNCTQGYSSEFRHIAIHEFGHVNGFPHAHTCGPDSCPGPNRDQMSRMRPLNPAGKYCASRNHGLHADSIHGGYFLYPTSNASYDIGVASWLFEPASWSSTGWAEDPARVHDPNNPDRLSNKCPNDKVAVQMGLSNRGNQENEADIKFYLSTDDEIGWTDFTLGTASDVTFTSNQSEGYWEKKPFGPFEIPSNINHDTQYRVIALITNPESSQTYWKTNDSTLLQDKVVIDDKSHCP